MFFTHRALSVAKDFGRPDENQDATAVDEDRGIAAIGDGASSSLFAARWTKQLVATIASDPPKVTDARTFPGWLAAQRAQEWLEGIDANNLAWHQKAKFAEGAFATLLWIELQDAASGEGFEYEVHALGDCCLFHVRGREVLRVFPLEHSEQFSVEPALIGSSPKQPVDCLEFQTLQGTCGENDLLVMATDAVAAWALAEIERNKTPDWDRLWNATPDAFRDMIEKLRGQQQIRYDDSTVLMLRVCGALPTSLGPSETVSERITQWARRVPRLGSWLSDRS